MIKSNGNGKLFGKLDCERRREEEKLVSQKRTASQKNTENIPHLNRKKLKLLSHL